MNPTKRTLSFAQKGYLFHLRNYAKVVRQQDQEEVNNMPIFQYATENTKKRKRLYMWGNAMFGALGNSNFIKPVTNNYVLESMRRPWRLPFADLHKVIFILSFPFITVIYLLNL